MLATVAVVAMIMATAAVMAAVQTTGLRRFVQTRTPTAVRAAHW